MSDVEELTINADFAKRYDNWRRKEELQKYKDRYGEDVDLDEDDSSSTSESEDDDAEALTSKVERGWLRTLAALKAKDPKIYDKNTKFYEESESTDDDDDSSPDEGTSQKKPDKPMFLRDYERKVIVENQGRLSDEENNENSNEDKPMKMLTYDEEQEALRQSVKKALLESDEDEGSEEDRPILKKRQKTKEQTEKEEADYLEWLKGQEAPAHMKEEIEKELGPLQSYWAREDLPEGEKFLRDYILNKGYLEDSGPKGRVPTYDEVVDDGLGFEEEEKELEKEETFEHKYNFRFEDPDPDFVKQYPRTISESMRRKEKKRSEKRKEVQERKKKEKEQKRSELLQLKKMKRDEINERIRKIQEVTGCDELPFTINDLDEDFDPDKHDELMQNAFSKSYYEGEETEKPEFDDDDFPEFEEEDYDKWIPEKDVQDREEDEVDEEIPEAERGNFNMDADAPDDNVPKKRRRRSMFIKTIKKKKPVFDPNEQKFEDFYKDYYNLECEDFIGDLPCRFKYRKVLPNNYGLSVGEILECEDKELNRWVSVKRMSAYCDEKEEKIFYNKFKRKAMKKKYDILRSLKKSANAASEKKSKRRRTRKKFTVEDMNESRLASVSNITRTGEVKVTKSNDKSQTRTMNQVITTNQPQKRKRPSSGQSEGEDGSKPEAGQSSKRRKSQKKLENKKKYKPALFNIPITNDRMKAYNLKPKTVKHMKMQERTKKK